MRSGGDDVATAIPEEPLSSLRQRFGAGPPRITMVDSEAVQTLTPLRYYLITQATGECALLLWHCGLRHMSGATWEPANCEEEMVTASLTLSPSPMVGVTVTSMPACS